MTEEDEADLDAEAGHPGAYRVLADAPAARELRRIFGGDRAYGLELVEDSTVQSWVVLSEEAEPDDEVASA